MPNAQDSPGIRDEHTRWREHDEAAPLRLRSLEDLSSEVRRARAKFPGNRHLLAACTEELGELAKAYLQRRPIDEIRQEALQTACVAMRIYEEGDATFSDLTDEEAKQ